MSDLVSRVLAAIEQAEHEARHTEPGPWAAWPSDMPGEFVVARVNERTGEKDPDHVATTHGLYCAEQNARFIARNDPAAVLRRCAADRIILQQHRPINDVGWICGVCIEPDYIGSEYRMDWPTVPAPCPTLTALASAHGISVEEETTMDEVLKTPLEWASDRGMTLLSATDWRRRGFPIDQPCTEADFKKTYPWCTVEY